MSAFMDFLGSRPPREALLWILAFSCAVSAVITGAL